MAEKVWLTVSHYSEPVPGSIGFLAERFDLNRNVTTHWDVRPTPLRTIGARQPLLIGGTGVYNNMTWIAHGLARVLKTTNDLTRVYVEKLDPRSPEAQAFLQGAGYPELIPTGAAA